MAHELKEYDNMISVKERPWHGLGIILEDVPTIAEAEIASGLTWTASIKPSYYEVTPGVFQREPGENAIVRDDVNIAIGHVGERYEIYQNADMWKFIETFQDQTECKIETAGSLKNGAVTWVLAKNGMTEFIKGDPIQEFFLFRNSFDGSSPIMVMDTDIRVVCNNTLTQAIRNSRNIFKVRHTQSASDQLDEVQKALAMRINYRAKFNEAMEFLVSKQIDTLRTVAFLEEVIFPEPKGLVKKGGIVVSLEEASKQALTSRKNKIAKVTDLIDGGAGADIAGVRGSAYGLYQALVEWSDHEKSIKVTKGRDRDEVRFENAFWGTGSTFKQECFDQILKLAA